MLTTSGIPVSDGSYYISSEEKEDPKVNKWIIPQEYYDLLDESLNMDFTDLHYSCPMYIGGFKNIHFFQIYEL